MPRNGSGVYTLPPIYFATAGTTIQAAQHNSPLQDIAQALTGSLPRDGSAQMLADLPMNGRRVSNLGAGVNPSDAARMDQVPVSAYLTSVSALALDANEMVYASGVNVAAKTALTAFARSLLNDADAATARTTLGLAAGAVAAALGQTAWNTGAATTEAIISPAKLHAKVAAQVAAGIHEAGPIATTSGTAHNITGIPAGMNHIAIIFDGVSLSGSDELLFQIGTGGSPTTSGYVSESTNFLSRATSTAGFVFSASSAPLSVSGVVRLDRVPGTNKWQANGDGFYSSETEILSRGLVTLSGPLNNIRLTRTGTNTFDAGSWSIRARA